MPGVADLAYIAGFFDGEGSVSVFKRKPVHGCINPIFILMVEITNIDKAVLEYIKSTIGLGGCLYGHIEPNKRTVYRLMYRGRQAIQFLELVKPFLKVKVSQTNLAIWMENIRYEGRHPKEGKAPKEITNDVLISCDISKSVMHYLNTGKVL